MKRALAVLLMSAAVAASATSVVPMSVEDLAGRSTHILRARAVYSWSEWNADHSTIYTYTRFETVSSLKGNAESGVVVKQLGGSAGGYTQKVSGVRPWSQGEEAVLFLRPSQVGDGSMIVTGLMQGDFRLSRARDGEVTASNGTPGVTAVERDGLADFRGTRMSLRELQRRVQRTTQ